MSVGPFEPLAVGDCNWRTLEGSARFVATAQWIELRLHEVVGSWGATTSEPASKLYFDACSRHHAWRASVIGECLPILAGVDPSSWAKPQMSFDSALEVAEKWEGVAGRLAIACRVVFPRLFVAYTNARGACSAGSDRPVTRALDIVLRDVESDWKGGLSMLVEHLHDRDAVMESAEATKQVDAALADGDPSVEA